MPEALDVLLDDGVIDAVLGQLKTGKEAEVWLVQHQGQVLAAKVYKERHERNFKNNAGYLEGRDVRNSRTRRAMAKGSKFGQEMAEEEWKRAEADALFKLHAAGVRVPTPAVFYEGVLLMEAVVDAEGRPAPRLVEAPPQTPEEARALYLDLRGHVIRMLCADLIHGDLSAFNILMAASGPTIIDFPQTLAAARNTQAERYFQRDLDNVRNFLAGVDASLHGHSGDTHEIWNAYVRRELTPDFVPRARGGQQDRARGDRPSRGSPPARGNDNARGDRRFGGAPQTARAGSDARPLASPGSAGPSPAAPELDPLEAELRAIEAQFLRQGGGERAKPTAPPSDAQNRNRRGGRGFGGGGRGGPGPQRGPKPSGAPQQRAPNAQGPNGQQQRGPRPQNPPQQRGAKPQAQNGQQQRGPNAQGPNGQQQRGPRPQNPPQQRGANPQGQNAQQRGPNGQPQNAQQQRGPRPQNQPEQRGAKPQPQNGQQQRGPRPPNDGSQQRGPRPGRPNGGRQPGSGRQGGDERAAKDSNARSGPLVSYVPRIR